jgi:hypothetical protein
MVVVSVCVDRGCEREGISDLRISPVIKLGWPNQSTVHGAR